MVINHVAHKRSMARNRGSFDNRLLTPSTDIRKTQISRLRGRFSAILECTKTQLQLRHEDLRLHPIIAMGCGEYRMMRYVIRVRVIQSHPNFFFELQEISYLHYGCRCAG